MAKQVRASIVPLLILVLGIGLGTIGTAWPDSSPAQFVRPGEAATEPVASLRASHPAVRRVGSVIGLNRETVDQYVLLHKYVWPQVLDRIRKSNIRNYSIYMDEVDGQLYLFSYYEYVGDDFEADMEAVANDPVTREWWKLTDPLQRRVRNTPTGAQWKMMEEVFHTD